MFQKNIFTYYITEKDVSFPHLSLCLKFGKYNMYIDSQTPYQHYEKNNCECLIYGLAVNVITGEHVDIAEKILVECDDIQSVVTYEKKLGGKYILLYKNGERYYLICDATSSIPVFYSCEKDFVCSDNFQNIIKNKNYTECAEYRKIRASGDISQAMPYDITSYKEVKQLLPNHFLNLNDANSIRYINSDVRQESISVSEATEIVKPMIENMLDYYSSLFKLYCPITGGRDSRVVLAFLMGKHKEFQCYTIKHPEHKKDSHDLVVPAAMCSQNKIPYELVEDIILTDEMLESADALLGKGNYSERTLRIAQTIKSNFENGAILNGDIIGQVGKCSLHRDIPAIFATPGYFRCKLHNFSVGARKQLKYWLREIILSGEKVNTFDLFSIENRMGRWAGQENLIYNSLGQLYLNLFNSRSVIYIWTSVNRAERKLSLIHNDFIKVLYPGLSEFQYETDEGKLVRLSKLNGVTYLISSYLKFYFEKMKFNEGKLYEKNHSNR